MPLRVRFSETDAMGVANNGAYLAWLEIGRIEYLRELGRDYREVHDGGLDLVVAEAAIRYLRPLRFDDRFERSCKGKPAAVPFLPRGRSRDRAREGSEVERLPDEPSANLRRLSRR